MARSIPAAAQVSIDAAHARLVELVRGRSRARLELGRSVDALARRGGHHELGYSSVGAYTLQRTGLSPRFVEVSRTMARRLFQGPHGQGLPLLAQALGRGRVSWSAAMRVAAALQRVASRSPQQLPDAEQVAVEAATTMTVRQLEQWLAQSQADAALARGQAQDQDDDAHLLQRTITPRARELVEATRALISFMDGHVSDEAFVDALLAEAHGAMTHMGPDMAQSFQREASRHDWAAAHGDVIQALRRARAQAQERRAEAAEARVAQRRAARSEATDSHADGPGPQPIAWTSLDGWSIEALDARVVEWGEQLALRDLEIADAALIVCAGRGWRRRGWSSQEQYALEELGMSASALRTIIARARRMIELPELRDALQAGRLGLVAAAAIGRVATPDSVDAWIERAGQRTVVHLREEVRAVELLARNGASTDLAPPTAAQLETVREFERSVASGAWFEALMDSLRPAGSSAAAADGDGDGDGDEPDPERQMCAGPEGGETGPGPGSLDPGLRRDPLRGALVFAGASGARDERLRLRVSDEQAGWWRYLERSFERQDRARAAFGEPAGAMSFVEFACLAVWLSWYPSVKATGAFDRWTSVYVRDRYQCSSPLCTRRDVTPTTYASSPTAAATRTRTSPPCAAGATSRASTAAASAPCPPPRRSTGASVGPARPLRSWSTAATWWRARVTRPREWRVVRHPT